MPVKTAYIEDGVASVEWLEINKQYKKLRKDHPHKLYLGELLSLKHLTVEKETEHLVNIIENNHKIDTSRESFINNQLLEVFNIAYQISRGQENLDELIAVGNQLLVLETNNLIGSQTKISLDEFLDQLYRKIYSVCIEYNRNRYCKK